MERIIFHIDVNSAYLSWTAIEELKKGADTDLRDIPSIIGGDQKSRHGVVLAKSIPAKKYGIKTGEPVAHALQKCPILVMHPPEHKKYHQYSQKLMHYLKGIAPDIEKVSIDECYMDFTGIAHRYASPEAAAALIKDTVYEQFGFTVNVGISSNKLLAKMASDFQKPNLVHTLFPSEIKEKMWPLPVSELYMAGKASVETFHKLDIYTIGQLACLDRTLLSSHLKSHGLMLHDYANGIDTSPVVSTHVDAKGIGNSTTLREDITEAEDAYKVLDSLARSVSRRLQEAGQLAGNVCVEIKYHTFTSSSHQGPLLTHSNSAEDIHRTSCQLFDQFWNRAPIRLLGIRCAKLISNQTPVQLNLFDLPAPKTEKQKKLDQALDQIRRKYGDDAVKRGSLD